MNKNGFVDLCCYTFPEIISTYRGIRDDNDVIRRCNSGLANGLISDVEIYRCRNTIADTPVYSAYLAQVNRLRKKYSRLILQGTYRHTQGVEIDSNKLVYTRFDCDNESAVVLTNNNDQEVVATLFLPGYCMDDIDGIGEFDIKQRDQGCSVKLQKESLVVCVFKKQ